MTKKNSASTRSILDLLSPELRAELLAATVHGDPLFGPSRGVGAARRALIEAREEVQLMDSVTALRLGWPGEFVMYVRRTARKRQARALAHLQRLWPQGVRLGQAADDVQLIA